MYCFLDCVRFFFSSLVRAFFISYFFLSAASYFVSYLFRSLFMYFPVRYLFRSLSSVVIYGFVHYFVL